MIQVTELRLRFPHEDFAAIPDRKVRECLDEAEGSFDRAVMDSDPAHPVGDEIVVLRAAAALHRILGERAKARELDEVANQVAWAAHHAERKRREERERQDAETA